MKKNIFETVLQTISTGLIDKIMSDSGLNEDEAIEKLYSSALYSMLEEEETKVWHYSVFMLHELYKSEASSGKLTLPEY
jgi:hypothetical protein